MTKQIRKAAKRAGAEGAEYFNITEIDGELCLRFRKCDEDDNVFEFIDGEWVHMWFADKSAMDHSDNWHKMYYDNPWWSWVAFGALLGWSASVLGGASC